MLKTLVPCSRRPRFALITIDVHDFVISPAERDSRLRSAYCRFVLSTFSMTGRIDAVRSELSTDGHWGSSFCEVAYQYSILCR
jgi:hypothetical protein